MVRRLTAPTGERVRNKSHRSAIHRGEVRKREAPCPPCSPAYNGLKPERMYCVTHPRISGFPPSFHGPILHHDRSSLLKAAQRGVSGKLMFRDSAQP